LPDWLPVGEKQSLPELHGLTGVGAALQSGAEHLRPDGDLWPVVFWPPQYNRARVYIHLIDNIGEPVGFLKLAQADDTAALWRERDALCSWNGGHGRVRTPRVLASGTDATTSASWLLLEPLPRHAHPVEGRVSEGLISEIRRNRRHVGEHELTSLSWWSELQRRLPDASDSFRTAFAKVVQQGGVDVSWVHGDLAPHNMATEGSRTWVFDWEHSAPDGPSDVDTFTLEIADSSPTDVLRRAASLPKPKRDAFVWSCAYGLASQNANWPSVLDAWDSLRGWDT
jgi:hypothetical protein